MIMKVRAVIKIIDEDGWYFHKQKGSHMQFRHLTKPGKVTVPNHGLNEDLDHKTVASILNQAGVTILA